MQVLCTITLAAVASEIVARLGVLGERREREVSLALFTYLSAVTEGVFAAACSSAKEQGAVVAVSGGHGGKVG